MEKEELFQILIDSIKKVREDYFCRYDASLLERPFCYELYHQFRLMQNKSSLILSGEPSKTLSYMMNGEKYPSQEDDKDRVYPDFILHKGLDDTSDENQIMAIEVKQNGNINKANLENDIKKLQRLVTKLHFDYGVFIAIGMTNKELITKLKETDKNIYKSKDKLYFIATKNINTHKKYLSYYDVFCEKQECNSKLEA